MTKDQFRQAIKRNGMTVDDFANLTGLHRDTVYRWGASGAVPYWVRLMMQLLDERHGIKGLKWARPQGS